GPSRAIPGDLFLPGRTGLWRTAPFEIQQLDADGEVRLRLQLSSKGRRVGAGIRRASVARDGSLAVLSYAEEQTASVRTCAHGGAPLSSLRIAGDWQELAFDGRRVALRRGAELLLLRVDGALVGRATLPAGFEEEGSLAFSPEGDELWAFRGAA